MTEHPVAAMADWPSGHSTLSEVDLRNAIEACLADQEVSPDQHPSMGCSIKWSPGNEPAYLIS